MKRIFFVLLCLSSISLEARTRHRSHAKKSAAHAAVKSSTHKKSAVRLAPGKVARHSKQPAKSAPTWRTRQQAPSPERYREIQEALAAKGYLKSEPGGVWNQESADALRRFQEEQNLEPSGKVNSLSLIALGLGPRTEASARPPVGP